MEKHTAIDPLQSGAIYKLKNVRSLRSPPIIKMRSPSVHKDSPSTVDRTLSQDEASNINERFDRAYRATHSPALQLYQQVILSSKQHNESPYLPWTNSSPLIMKPLLNDSTYYTSPQIKGVGAILDSEITQRDANTKNVIRLKDTEAQTVISAATHHIVATHRNDLRNSNASRKYNLVSSQNYAMERDLATPIVDSVEQTKKGIEETSKSDIASPPSDESNHNRDENGLKTVTLNEDSIKNDRPDRSPQTAMDKTAAEVPATIENNNQDVVDYDSSKLLENESKSQTKLDEKESGNSTQIETKAVGPVPDLPRPKIRNRMHSVGVDSLSALFASPSQTSSQTILNEQRSTAASTGDHAMPRESMKSKELTTQNERVNIKTVKEDLIVSSKDEVQISQPIAVNTKSTRSGRRTVPTIRFIDEFGGPEANNTEKSTKPGNDKIIPKVKEKEANTQAPSSSFRKHHNDSESRWLPQEFAALYTAYGKTEVTAPDFWYQISNELNRLGIKKSVKECQDRWFQSLQEAEQRRLKKSATSKPSAEARFDHSQTDVAAIRSPPLFSPLGENKYRSKKKLSKAAMKKLAEESVKASHEDNLFESQDALDEAPLASSTTLRIDAIHDIMSPKDPGEDSENEWKTKYSHRSKEIDNHSNNSRITGITKAESGKLTYIANFRKRVRSLQRAHQDSLLNLPIKAGNTLSEGLKRKKATSTLPNQKQQSKRPRITREGIASGFISPKSSRVKVTLDVDSDIESDEEEVDSGDD